MKRKKHKSEIGKVITSAMIEELDNYAGKYHSSIIDDVLSGKKSKDKWSYVYTNSDMRIHKGVKLSWEEVLTIIKRKISNQRKKSSKHDANTRSRIH